MTLDRRGFLAACSRAGLASPLMPGILYTLAAQAQESDKDKKPELAKITDEMIDRAAELAGVGPFTLEQKRMMLDGLNENRGGYEAIRSMKLPNSVPPAFVFHPLQAGGKPLSLQPVSPYTAPTAIAVAPPRIEDLAFATVAEMAALLRARKITSVDLTQMYLDRLKRYDSKLHFVITMTEERALEKAR